MKNTNWIMSLVNSNDLHKSITSRHCNLVVFESNTTKLQWQRYSVSEVKRNWKANPRNVSFFSSVGGNWAFTSSLNFRTFTVGLIRARNLLRNEATDYSAFLNLDNNHQSLTELSIAFLRLVPRSVFLHKKKNVHVTTCHDILLRQV